MNRKPGMTLIQRYCNRLNLLQGVRNEARKARLLVYVCSLLVAPGVRGQGEQTETQFILAPRVSYNWLAFQPTYSSTQGPVLFSYNPEPPSQIVTLNGQREGISIRPFRYGLDLGLKQINGRTKTGWSVLAGVDWGRQFYGSLSERSFSFKGNRITGWNVYLSYWQLNGALAYHWEDVFPQFEGTGAFIRLGVNQAHYLNYVTPKLPIRDQFTIDFTENGQGDKVVRKQYAGNVLSLTPEVGVSYGLLEVSVSASLPQTIAFSEQHTFFRNDQVEGVNEIGYRTGGVYVNARLMLPVVRHWKHIRAKRAQPQVVPTEPPVVYRKGQTVRLNNVYFKTSSAELLAESYRELDRLVDHMLQTPTLRIRLEGHTDVIGNAALNQQLSEDRVATIREYMIRNGVASHRVETVGYGDSKPLKRNCSPPEGCPENRRVEFVVLTN
ncbi:Outer membrane porin F AltName: Full=Root adhesin (plasmid) [Fibrisoma limi BUZ 3]|uniref:OprF protein n=1 Tax=Fibrisoma limi BUZ 3 TaxID=1185876 RepID=I2GTV9_9BACT|nr:OmpA family protein [Fibrisoma limi]CCH57560.1 Outer membrane porin F AltName: Full=Root adhesin [Fibrisoma limi BUZ 3]